MADRRAFDNQQGNWSKCPNPLSRSDLSGNAIKVLLFIASEREDFNHSEDVIARETQLCKATVVKVIKELDFKGWLTYKQIRKGRGVKNIYRVLLPANHERSHPVEPDRPVKNTEPPHPEETDTEWTPPPRSFTNLIKEIRARDPQKREATGPCNGADLNTEGAKKSA